MRHGNRRQTLALIAALTAAVSVASPAVAGPAVAGPTDPAGFSIWCAAQPLEDGPFKTHGVLAVDAAGRCNLTGSLGAPWILAVTVKLQEKVGGAWHTRASTSTFDAEDAAKKRIDWLGLTLACVGSPVHRWRGRVITLAYVSEKTVTTLSRRVSDTGIVDQSC